MTNMLSLFHVFIWHLCIIFFMCLFTSLTSFLIGLFVFFLLHKFPAGLWLAFLFLNERNGAVCMYVFQRTYIFNFDDIPFIIKFCSLDFTSLDFYIQSKKFLHNQSSQIFSFLFFLEIL